MRGGGKSRFHVPGIRGAKPALPRLPSIDAEMPKEMRQGAGGKLPKGLRQNFKQRPRKG
jgi:hypothetical protein